MTYTGPGTSCAACKACGAHAQCRTPFQAAVPCDDAAHATTKHPVLIIGENPSEGEDFDGGLLTRNDDRTKLLMRTLTTYGVDLNVCAYTTAVRCAVLEQRGGYHQIVVSKTPTSKHINSCREHLVAEIERIAPRAILLLGNTPLRALFKKSGVTKERRVLKTFTTPSGKAIPCAVSFAPSYPLRDANQMDRFKGDIKFFAEHVLNVGRKKTFTPQVELYPSVQMIRTLHADAIANSTPIGFDVEADELHVYTRDDWKLLTMSVSDGTRTYVAEVDPCNVPTAGRVAKVSQVAQAMIDMYTDKNVRLVLHGGKYDVHAMWRRFGVWFGRYEHDTLLLHSHVYPIQGGHDLKAISSDILGVHDYTAELKPYIGNGTGAKRYGLVPYTVLGKYNGYDTCCTARLVRPLLMKVERMGLRSQAEGVKYMSALKSYTKVVMPTQRALCFVERAGLQIRKKYLNELSDVLAKESQSALAELRTLPQVVKWEKTKHAEALADFTQTLAARVAKRPSYKPPKSMTDKLLKSATFNPNSSPHVISLVHDAEFYGQPITDKTPTGAPSVGADTLEELVRTSNSKSFKRFVSLMQESKQAAHYRTTYVEGMRELVDKAWRIHPIFKVYGADTGRTSCSEPNAQNIPRDARMRNIFGARKGCRLVDADYSQVELRVQAAFSGDRRMLDVYKTGRDLHTETALNVYGHKNEKDVTKEQRQSCKAVNFGTIYCVGGKTLAAGLTRDLKRLVTPAEADGLIESFFNTYPDVLEWQMEMKQFAAEHGYVYTMFGTRRLILNAKMKGTTFDQRRLREDAFRQACNTPVQGTAGWITMVALKALRMEYVRRKLPARVVLTVHDSITTECEASVVDEVKQVKKDIMENEPLKFIGKHMRGVPLLVDFKVGEAWGDAA
jgi:uracil-DNA glycosylase family 4